MLVTFSLTLEDTGPGLVLESTLNTAAFDANVGHLLAPTLRPRQVVVVDTLRYQRGERARGNLAAPARCSAHAGCS